MRSRLVKITLEDDDIKLTIEGLPSKVDPVLKDIAGMFIG